MEQEAALVLGSLIDQSPSGYRLEVQLTQKGAGIESVASSQYKAEFKIGQPVRQPLTLMSNDRPFGPGEHARPPSLAVTFSQGDAAVQPAGADEPKEEDAALRTAAAEAEDMLDSVLWEVVRDENHKIVRSVTGTDPITNAEIMGQAIVFRTKAANGVVVTKTFRLFPNTDGLEVTLRFESPDKERSVSLQPARAARHSHRRRVVHRHVPRRGLRPGQRERRSRSTHTRPATLPRRPKLIDNTTLPLDFAGVENQYFAILVEPAKHTDRQGRPLGQQDDRTAAQEG